MIFVMFTSQSLLKFIKLLKLSFRRPLRAEFVNLVHTIRISPAAKDSLPENGYDIHMGARPQKRANQKYLETPWPKS